MNASFYLPISMKSTIKNLLRHDGLHLLAMATVFGYLVMCMIPEPFLRLDSRQKKELIKSRIRRLRRNSEDLFDFDEEENEPENPHHLTLQP